MLIYLAGPLFNEAEKAFNLQLTEKLEDRAFAVFLPQRDDVESSKPPWDEMTDHERRQAIFTTDRDKVLEADILLFVLDGRVPDEGACVELGIAHAQKFLLQRDKLLIGLQTDSRGAFLGAKLNAMLYGALETTTDNENDLIVTLEAYRQARTEGRDL